MRHLPQPGRPPACWVLVTPETANDGVHDLALEAPALPVSHVTQPRATTHN